jgi:phosphate-selective porin OprO/OprP
MKHFFITIILLLIVLPVASQSDDEHHLLSVKKDSIKWTVGARFMADAAYYSDNDVLTSGVSITDARIRTSLTYGDYYFYYDAAFPKGKFSQKDIYFQYSYQHSRDIRHNVKVGYFSNIASMGYNTGSFNYHFITRPAPILAFSTQRHLGASYRFTNRHILVEQGIFSEKPYHKKDEDRGLVVSGRFVYKAINNEKINLHFGVSARYRKIFQSNHYAMTDTRIFPISKSSLETNVDNDSSFLNVTNLYASSISEGTFEFIFRMSRFFARGEGIFRYVEKDKQTSLHDNLYGGAYIEAGYLILGDNYTYNEKISVIGGLTRKNSLEVVVRYSYTHLNDILNSRSEMYNDGGRMHIATAGINFFLNKYIGFMAAYSCSFASVYNDKKVIIHTAQLKMMFSF